MRLASLKNCFAEFCICAIDSDLEWGLRDLIPDLSLVLLNCLSIHLCNFEFSEIMSRVLVREVFVDGILPAGLVLNARLIKLSRITERYLAVEPKLSINSGVPLLDQPTSTMSVHLEGKFLSSVLMGNLAGWSDLEDTLKDALLKTNSPLGPSMLFSSARFVGKVQYFQDPSDPTVAIMGDWGHSPSTSSIYYYRDPDTQEMTPERGIDIPSYIMLCGSVRDYVWVSPDDIGFRGTPIYRYVTRKYEDDLQVLLGYYDPLLFQGVERYIKCETDDDPVYAKAILCHTRAVEDDGSVQDDDIFLCPQPHNELDMLVMYGGDQATNPEFAMASLFNNRTALQTLTPIPTQMQAPITLA